MLAACVHSGHSEAEPRREALLIDIIDLLTVMGAAAGGGGGGAGGGGSKRQDAFRLMSAPRYPSLRIFFLITRKVNPQSMKM